MFFLISPFQGRPDIPVKDYHIESPYLPFLGHGIFELYRDAFSCGQWIDQRRSPPDESYAASVYAPQGLFIIVASYRTEIGIKDNALHLRIPPYRPLSLLERMHATDGGTV